MSTVRVIFEDMGALYEQFFYDFLFIHVSIRTIILLLVVWMFIYASAQVLQYLVLPLITLFYYHIVFRLWNFLFIETVQEWLYIHYYANERPNFRRLYLRLCDRVKYNRALLAHTKYSGILYRGRVRKFTTRLMIVLMVVCGLWTAAFGIYNEYVFRYPADYIDKEHTPDPETPPKKPAEEPPLNLSPAEGPYNYGINAPYWPENETIYLLLNESGWNGSNIRDLPNLADSSPIEVVNGAVHLLYLHQYAQDENGLDMLWLKVRTPSGNEGYISSALIIRAGED